MIGQHGLNMTEEQDFNRNEELIWDMMNLNRYENEMQGDEQDEIENRSTNKEANLDENDPKRRYHSRHTPEQIQALEAFFRECPHPSNLRRSEIGQELGLEPLQVRFWFQNKRAQMKTKNEHLENRHLRAVNERIRAENSMLIKLLSNVCCRNCGQLANFSDHMSADERQLMIENARLRVEIEQMKRVAGDYIAEPIIDSNEAPSSSNAAILCLTGSAAHGYQGTLGNVGYQGASSSNACFQEASGNVEK